MNNSSSMKKLFQEIIQSVTDSVSEAESRTFLDALNELDNSYKGGEPKQYKRTNKMKNSPKTTGVISSGNRVSATVYLDQSYDYDTGTYYTPKVFSEAESGGSGIKMTPGFWKKTEKKAQINLINAMGKRFK
ncbi:MAG: hypothetical protein ACLTBR_03525 [Anaerostipes sp.]|uniref:hypothetical protein n=1 Tax=Anaerostipes sp. TaxID=1872530 RepID=UPI003994DD74